VNISEPFIKRPVMTTLVMTGLLLFGIQAYRLLPVSDLPNVDFPTILVSAVLPGASPETMASAVATPLERQFTRIAAVSEMTSTSSLEKVKHTLEEFLQDRPAFSPSLRDRYDRLIIYILTDRQKTYSQSSIDAVLKGRFAFLAARDIWDFTNLLADIQGLPLAKKETILRILKNQIGLTLGQFAPAKMIKAPRGKYPDQSHSTTCGLI